MSSINKPSQPLIAPTDVEEVEEIATSAAEAAIAADDTHAPLVDNLVPSENLPSYVDDVLEFADAEHFPVEGEVGKIYVAQDTNLTYRWSGAAYIQVGGASLGAGDGIEIENDIVSVDEDYLNGHLEFEAPIEDLDTIRSGAEAGATAAQPADVAAAVADNIEVIEYQDQTPITEAQLAKAVAGKLAIHCNGRLYAKYYQSEAIINFHSFDIGHNISSSTTVTSTMQSKEWVILLNRETRMLSNSGYMPVTAIGDYADNFLEGSDEVAEDGKKLIREKDLYPVKELAESAVQPEDIDALSDAEIALLWRLPIKGNIIKFDAFGNNEQKRFRVIKINNGIATLLSLDNPISSCYDISDRKTTFDDGKQYQAYNNVSFIDNYILPSYYNSLSNIVKEAIVPTDITQSCYTTSGWNQNQPDSNATFNVLSLRTGKYNATNRITQVHVGVRDCFILDIDDLVEYFGLNTGDILNGADLNNCYFEQSTIVSPAQFVWLTSAVGNVDKYVWCVSTDGELSGYNSTATNITYPAFRIDLSKIDFTKEAQ